MLPRIPSLLVVLLALLTGCATTAAWPVVNYDPLADRSSPVAFAGTGFLWKGRYVLTSAHACSGDTLDVIVENGLLSTKRVQGTVLAREGDIAVVDLGCVVPGASFHLSWDDAYPGQEVTIIDGSRSSRPEIPTIALSGDTLRVAADGGSIRRGSSGSPVVDSSGSVVGIVFASLHLGGQHLVSIHPVSAIRELLQDVLSNVPVVERTTGLRADPGTSRAGAGRRAM
jgi:hypothetical protein